MVHMHMQMHIHMHMHLRLGDPQLGRHVPQLGLVVGGGHLDRVDGRQLVRRRVRPHARRLEHVLVLALHLQEDGAVRRQLGAGTGS